MSFAIQMANDLCQVEPGSTVPVAIEVANRSDNQVGYEIEIEGLDPTWTAVPVPTFTVDPGESHVERFFLKPPRDSESLAGTYPYVVVVRSLETGETKTVQGALEVRPYTNFSVDIQPRRGTLSPFAKTTQFQVKVMNLGNAEETLQLLAADTENMFAFEFDASQVTLGPGQERALMLSAAGSKTAFLASSRLQSFTVSARSAQNPAAAAAATGQIEQRAAATPGAFFMTLVLLALATVWILLWPKPPSFDSLVVEPSGKVFVGQPVQIKWKASRASSVLVKIGNWIQDRQLPEGELTYVPDAQGDYVVEMTATSGDRRVKDTSHVLHVESPPAVPKPEIQQLSVEEKQLKLGQTFLLNYKFSDSVVRATLYPMQRDLDVKEHSIQLTADMPGKIKYTVKAYNSANQQTESSVVVTVVKTSKARIVRFAVDPLQVDATGGTVVVSWSVLDAVKLELVYADKTVDITNSNSPGTATGELAGQLQFNVKEETQFKIIAYDEDNVPIGSNPITVKVNSPPGNTGGDPGSAGGGH